VAKTILKLLVPLAQKMENAQLAKMAFISKTLPALLAWLAAQNVPMEPVV
jgi:hypothetical protein